MIDGKTILAIIPARGGSKGLARKNIRELNGKPLIAYTIEEAIKSEYIDRIVVTTEDSEIAKVSMEYGAEVPFMRPDNLARDDTPGIAPIIHCVEWLRDNEGYYTDYVYQLQCTLPLRTVKHIDNAMEVINKTDSDTVVSVCKCEHSPYWMKRIEDGKLVDFLDSDINNKRRQELPTIYRLNGAIHIAKTDIFLNNRDWYTDCTIPYLMDKISSIDIDDIYDFKFVEFLLKEKWIDGLDF